VLDYGVIRLLMHMLGGEIILFIGKKPKGRSMIISESTATNALKESRKEFLLGCAGCTSICVAAKEQGYEYINRHRDIGVY